MSTADVLVIAFYASLAAAALFLTYRDRDLVWIGVWLALACILSNVMWGSGVEPKSRTGIYTFFECMIALATYCAWGAHRHRALAAVIFFNVLSISANVALASVNQPSPRQIFTWAMTTNMCFAAECLLACWMGIVHGLQSGRFDRWPRFRRASAQPSAARSNSEPGG